MPLKHRSIPLQIVYLTIALIGLVTILSVLASWQL
jgi:hypothetical protein